ncbi:MAG: type II toxin-antitoxin system RelE/ParE family toxin [Thermodesulfovibrionales bacterium]
MGKYSIEFSKKAAKSYARLPEDYKTLVDLALYKLSEGLPVDIKPILGEKDIYRIRVGRYRILFTIIDNVVLISSIGPRGDIYK